MHRLRSARTLLALSLVLIFPNLVFATTRTVRKDGTGDFLTIGAAVAAAVPNDVIEVGPGVYKEQVDVLITLTFVSTSGAANTTIDGEHFRYTIWFRAGTGHVLDGFTLKNGEHISGGGATRCQAGAQATLKNCVFESNHSGHDGGAIFTRDTNSFIDAYDCVFKNNNADHNGGAGIAILGSRINYTRCKFTGNTADEQNSSASCDHSYMDVKQCLFVGNNSASFSGIYYYLALGGTVESNTLWNNFGGEWSNILIHYTDGIVVTRNIIGGNSGAAGLAYIESTGPHTCNVYYQNNGGDVFGAPMDASEIHADPKFCDVAGNNLSVGPTSPAAPANNSCGVLIGAYPVSCIPLAAAISSFEARERDGVAFLQGTFRSNMTVEAVNVYRAEGDKGGFIRIAITPPVDGTQFEYADRSAASGKSYRYQIGVVDGDGEFLSPIQRLQMSAFATGLEQNHPNPFNPTTTIRFTLAASERVTLVVYDAAGRAVRTLVDDTRPAGAHDIAWDGRDNGGGSVASGVYFCQLKTGKVAESKRMVMLK